MHDPEQAMRLNRFLARAGLGSRRAVEDLVRAGRVTIGGETVTDLGRRVDPARDKVAVDGRPVTVPEDLRVYAFHKPLDVVSTLKAQGGQPSLLPYRIRADLPERFVPVGRLDADSSGLLLWTDDGELNQALCRPVSGVWKTYEVTLDKGLPLARVPDLTEGRLELDGRPVRPCRLAAGRDTRHWTMELHEGRKRQIRRMFKAVGMRVRGLHRIGVGPVHLGKLRPGDFRRLTAAEVEALRRSLAGR
ncbi:MAG: pseudouridine synthase [Candidatus Krumholzibacteriia bacterium]